MNPYFTLMLAGAALAGTALYFTEALGVAMAFVGGALAQAGWQLRQLYLDYRNVQAAPTPEPTP